MNIDQDLLDMLPAELAAELDRFHRLLMERAIAKMAEQLAEVGATMEAVDGGRYVVMTHNGKSRSMQTSHVVWRGTWRPSPYLTGDVVYHEGSTWHCGRATNSEPGTSDAWVIYAADVGPTFDDPVEVQRAS